MIFFAFLGMFIAEKMAGSHNRFYVKKNEKNTNDIVLTVFY